MPSSGRRHYYILGEQPSLLARKLNQFAGDVAKLGDAKIRTGPKNKNQR
jgi:hypothetical protein